jgi:hypothetical protein
VHDLDHAPPDPRALPGSARALTGGGPPVEWSDLVPVELVEDGC